jgi:hypothetical protein
MFLEPSSSLNFLSFLEIISLQNTSLTTNFLLKYIYIIHISYVITTYLSGWKISSGVNN